MGDIDTLRESAATVSVVEFADMLGVSPETMRRICKMRDGLLRPPGFKSGSRYRVFVCDAHDYIHATGRFEGKGFPAAMEAVSA